MKEQISNYDKVKSENEILNTHLESQVSDIPTFEQYYESMSKGMHPFEEELSQFESET